jgi:hypothetical protein
VGVNVDEPWRNDAAGSVDASLGLGWCVAHSDNATILYP